jgi:hypothetical protein
MRRVTAIVTVLLVAGIALGLAIGLWVGSRRHNPAAAGTPIATIQPKANKRETSDNGTNCYFVRYLTFQPKKGPDHIPVQWELCDEQGMTANYVYLGGSPDETQKPLFTFGPTDILQQLEVTDLDSDGNEELLMVGQAAGTGNYIEWCVLGWSAGALKCWQVPDIDNPVKRLTSKDEHFCCKDWILKRTHKRLILGRGIYHTGDGNCCPTRGGAFVDLVPENGQLRLQRAWRTSLDKYQQWSWKPDTY